MNSSYKKAVSNPLTPRRKQILRLDNGRFLTATLFEAGKRGRFLALDQDRTFKGEDRFGRPILFRVHELSVVLERLFTFKSAFDSGTFSGFSRKADRAAWLIDPTSARNFFYLDHRQNGDAFLIITRLPNMDETEPKTIGVFREEVEQVRSFIADQIRALEALEAGELPDTSSLLSPEVEAMDLAEVYTPAEEDIEDEYTPDEVELLSRCDDYPGLVSLAEERIVLARRLALLEAATEDLKLAKLERALEAVDRKIEAVGENVLPAKLYSERERLVVWIRWQRDNVPVCIEDQEEELRARIKEIDDELELEFSKGKLFRAQAEEADSDEDDSRERE